MTKNSGIELWKKAKKLIPGGNQLLSKRGEQFLPNQWMSYYNYAKGVEIWDLDYNRFIDMSIMGIGACPLGYADPDVDRAVKTRIDNGSTSTLNCPEEIELAEVLTKLHPWSEMVRYARCGGEAMAVAVRIARAHTHKDIIAFSGYHGWHDWYLAANLADNKNLDGHLLPGLSPAGVPRGLIGTAIPFEYNKIDELRAIQKKHGKDLAAIIMEPIRNHKPSKGFFKEVQEIADETGAVLIMDEISSGFRLNIGGAHLLQKIKPDIAVFSKGMSNGYPMAAIIGTRGVMQSAQDTFMSSTCWSECIGNVAALATIKKYKLCKVPEYLIAVGKSVQEGWREIADRVGIEIEIGGIPPLSHFSFIGDEDLVAQSVYTKLMLEKGFLAKNLFYASYAHQPRHVSPYLIETENAFEKISIAREENSLRKLLKGSPAHKGFRRLI